MPQPVAVVIVSNDSSIRAMLRRTLEMGGLTVAGEAANEGELLGLVARGGPNVVVLMHLSPPASAATAVARRLHRAYPGVAIVAYSAFSDSTSVLAAVDAGVRGYVAADDDTSAILSALLAAAEGGSPLSPTAATALIDARANRSSAELTSRERDVLILVANGLTNKEIADQLGISERTVKAHLTSAFRRLGVRGRTQAALWVRDHLGPLNNGPNTTEGRRVV